MGFTKLKIDKEFFIKNKIVLMCILCTIFALLTPFWNGFCWILYATLMIFSIFNPLQHSLCLYGYLFFFAGLTGAQAGHFILYCTTFFGALIRYIYEVITKKSKIAKKPLIVSIVFYLVSLIPFWNYTHFFGIGIALMALVPIYLVYIYRRELDAINIVKYMFAGLLASVIIGYLFCCLFGIGKFSIIHYTSERYQFFADNPNYLTIGCLMIIAGIFIAILKHRINWWTGVLLISICIFAGAQSKSKAFMLMLFLLICIVFLILVFKNKKVGFILLVSVTVVGCLLVLLFRNYFEYVISRFFTNGHIDIYSITTNRWKLWSHFLSVQFSNPINVILGMGAWAEVFTVKTEYFIGEGCHSIYLEFFYHFGVIGVILLGVLIWAYVKTSKEENGNCKSFIRFEDLLPLIIILIMGIGEIIIFSPKAFFVPLFIIFIYNGVKNIPRDSKELARLNIFKQKKKFIGGKHEK